MSAASADERTEPRGTTEMTDMAAAVWTGPGTIEVRRVPVPDVPTGWALVRTEFVGLCGTDFSIFHGTHPRATAPLIPGHEITGVVAAAAEGGPARGTRVIVEPLIVCGSCHACAHGHGHVCESLGLYGIDRPGAMAEYVALPAAALVPIDESAPPSEVALAEPLAVAVHAVDMARQSPGDTVVVLGAGPIGILTALVARHRGAGRVIVSEVSAPRRELAAALGFDTVPADADPVRFVRAATGEVGGDVVYDTAGHPAVAAQSTAIARVRGTVVVVGVYKRPTEVDLQRVNFAELTMIGTRVYTRADVEEAARLIGTGELGLGRLPISVHALADAAGAFAEAMSAGAALKVLVAPSGAPA